MHFAGLDFQAFVAMVFTLFLIVDPIGCLPLIPELLRNRTAKEQRVVILRATIIAFFVLTFFAVCGKLLLDYFGVGLAAVRIAGGILLFGIGAELLYGRMSGTETTDKEEEEAKEKKDVSVTPLAIPLIAGPGAIATVMLFSSSHEGFSGILLIILAIATVMVISLLLLLGAKRIGRSLGTIGVKVIARVMGLLLIFSATQVFLEGLKLAGVIA